MPEKNPEKACSPYIILFFIIDIWGFGGEVVSALAFHL
jgi:hypothetical protein